MRELVDKQLMLEDAKSWVAMDSYDQHWINNMSAWIENLPTVEVSDEDCISRQAAIDAIIDELIPSVPLSAVIRAKNRLEDLPTAQPEPHEGHWIGGDGSYICSECNGSPLDFIDTMGASFDAYVETPMNYCPNCGAKMKGE